MEKEEVNNHIDRKKSVLRDLTNKDKSFSDEKQIKGHDILDSMSISEIQAETDEIRKKVGELRDKSEYYDSMKAAMEELGGMKILSVTSIAQPSPSKNTKSSSPIPSTLSQNNESICLKVRLLDEHIVQVVLASISRPRSNPSVETFRVTSAHFITPTTINDTIEDPELRASNQTPTVSCVIPPLDDLVSLSSNLEPMHDLRFVLREAMARVRALSALVDELAQLRMKYLTKITKTNKSGRQNKSFGGEDQEVVCSLSTGVTVVLRLTIDCPMIDGSAYIQQIVGVAGWDEEYLHRIKDAVNEKKCRSPVHCMDLLVKEIERIEKEEGLTIPKTPTLPKRVQNIIR